MLCAHFKKKKITRKVIQDVYRLKDNVTEKMELRFKEIQQQLTNAVMDNRRIIFRDKVTFKNKQDKKIEYSNVGQNIKIVKDNQRFQPVVLNFAVSSTNGIEGYELFDKPLNSKQFCGIFE